MIQKISGLFRGRQRKRATLQTDVHSHLIPGIDDGAKTLGESLNLIRILHSLGYRKLITTPHTMSHRYPNDRQTILEGLETLRGAIKDARIDIAVEAASEYYLDEHFAELITEKNLLTFGKNNVLFEMSYLIEPPQLDSVIFELQSSGYTPVLAHPERYLFLHKRFERYRELKERGVRFQVNINSLGGFYSKAVRKVAQQIMYAGWIDYLGSDTHHRRHTDSLAATLESGIVAKVLEKNTLLNDTL